MPAVIAGALALVGASGRAQLPETAGTLPEDYLPALKQILDSAMKQSPQVLLKQIEISQWEARVLITDAQRLPSAGGNFNYASNQTARSDNSTTRTRDNGLFYNFSLSQPLFQWGALKNQSLIARIGVSIAEKNYGEMRRSLAVSLRQTYLMLIAQKALVRHDRARQKLQQADLDLTQGRFAQGAASEAEVGGKKLGLDETNLAVARRESEFAAQRKAVARLAGLADIAEEAVPDEIPKPAYSAEVTARLLAALLRDGAKSTFAAEVAQLRIQESDLNLRIAKVRLLPKFRAEAGYSVQNNTSATQTSINQVGIAQQSAGIFGDWRIFDGFATKGAKQEALSTKRIHERELQIAVETALDSAQRLERDLALDAREMEQTEVRRTLAMALVDSAREEIARGNMKPAGMDEAKVALYAADYNNANARAKFLWHWSEFVSLAATDPVVNNLPSHYAREKR
jgi:outer membrane protein TolC